MSIQTDLILFRWILWKINGLVCFHIISVSLDQNPGCISYSALFPQNSFWNSVKLLNIPFQYYKMGFEVVGKWALLLSYLSLSYKTLFAPFCLMCRQVSEICFPTFTPFPGVLIYTFRGFIFLPRPTLESGCMSFLLPPLFPFPLLFIFSEISIKLVFIFKQIIKINQHLPSQLQSIKKLENNSSLH